MRGEGRGKGGGVCGSGVYVVFYERGDGGGGDVFDYGEGGEEEDCCGGGGGLVGGGEGDVGGGEHEFLNDCLLVGASSFLWKKEGREIPR